MYVRIYRYTHMPMLHAVQRAGTREPSTPTRIVLASEITLEMQQRQHIPQTGS